MAVIGIIDNAVSPMDAYLDTTIAAYQTRLTNTLREIENKIVKMAAKLDVTPDGLIKGPKWTAKQSLNIYSEMESLFQVNFGAMNQEYVNGFSQVRGVLENMLSGINIPVSFTRVDGDLLKGLQSQTLNGLTTFGDQVKNNVTQQLQNAIVSGGKFTDLVNGIRGAITGLTGEGGRSLTQYSSVYAQDGLMNAFRTLQKKKADDAGVSKFIWYGNVKSTSRPICCQHAGEILTKEELNELDLHDWEGKSDSVWKTLGGWNCRHHLVPVSDEYADELEALDTNQDGKIPVRNYFAERGMPVPPLRMWIKNPATYNNDVKVLKLSKLQYARIASKQAEMEAAIAAAAKRVEVLKQQAMKTYQPIESGHSEFIVSSALAAKSELGVLGQSEGNQIVKALYEHSFGSKLDDITYVNSFKTFPVKATSPWSLEFNKLATQADVFAGKQKVLFDEWVNIGDRVIVLKGNESALSGVVKTLQDEQANLLDMFEVGGADQIMQRQGALNYIRSTLNDFRYEIESKGFVGSATVNKFSHLQSSIGPQLDWWNTVRLYNNINPTEQVTLFLRANDEFIRVADDFVKLVNEPTNVVLVKATRFWDVNKTILAKLDISIELKVPQLVDIPVYPIKNITKYVKPDGELINVSESLKSAKTALAKVQDELYYLELTKDAVRPTVVKNLNDAVMYELAGQQYDLFYGVGVEPVVLRDINRVVKISAKATDGARSAYQEAYVAMYNGMKADVDPAIQTLITKVKNKLLEEVAAKNKVDVEALITQFKGIKKVEEIQKIVVSNFMDDENVAIAFIEGLGPEASTVNVQVVRTLALVGPSDSVRYRAFEKYMNLYNQKNPIKQSLKDLMQSSDVSDVKKAIADLWSGSEGVTLVDDVINSAIINEFGIEGTFGYGVMKIPAGRINPVIQQAVRELYDETQTFYKTTNTQFVKVYKGVKPTVKLERGVAVDHWHTQYNSASKEKFMGKTGVVENKAVSPQFVFVSNETHPKLFYNLNIDKDVYLLNEIPSPANMKVGVAEVVNLTEDEAKLQLAKLKAVKKEAVFQAEVYDVARKENYADVLTWQIEDSSKTVNFTKDFDHSDYVLNDIPFTPAKGPKSFKLIPDKKLLDEPSIGPGEWLDRETGEVLQIKEGYHQAVGVIVEEADGRIWIVEPESHYGGYMNTFAKGTVDKGFTPQQTALKEAFEEMGLSVEIDGYIGDYEKTKSITRYYSAKRIGGDPSKAHWESYKVKLATVDDLQKNLLNNTIDKQVLADYFEKKVAAPIIKVVKTVFEDDPDKQVENIVKLKKQIKIWMLNKTANPYAPANSWFQLESVDVTLKDLKMLAKWGDGEWQLMAKNELPFIETLSKGLNSYMKAGDTAGDLVGSIGNIVGYKDSSALKAEIKLLWSEIDSFPMDAPDAYSGIYWKFTGLFDNMEELRILAPDEAIKYDHLSKFMKGYFESAYVDKKIAFEGIVGKFPPIRLPVKAMDAGQTAWFNSVKYQLKQVELLADKPKGTLFKGAVYELDDLFSHSKMTSYGMDPMTELSKEVYNDLLPVQSFANKMKDKFTKPFQNKSADMKQMVTAFIQENRLKPSFPEAAQVLAAQPKVMKSVLSAAQLDAKLIDTWNGLVQGAHDWNAFGETKDMYLYLDAMDNLLIKVKEFEGEVGNVLGRKWGDIDKGVNKLIDIAGTRNAEINMSKMIAELDKIPLLNPIVSVEAAVNPTAALIFDDAMVVLYKEFQLAGGTNLLDEAMVLYSKDVADLSTQIAQLGDDVLSKKWAPFTRWTYKGDKFLQQEIVAERYSVLFEKFPKMSGIPGVKEVKVDPAKIILDAAKAKGIVSAVRKSLTEAAASINKQIGLKQIPWEDTYFYKIEDTHNQVWKFWASVMQKSDHVKVGVEDMNALVSDLSPMKVELEHLIALGQHTDLEVVLKSYVKDITNMEKLVDTYAEAVKLKPADWWIDIESSGNFFSKWWKEKPSFGKKIAYLNVPIKSKIVDDTAKIVKETIVGQVDNWQKFESKLDFVPGSQKGSNPGGDFINRDTKEKFYGKFYKDMEQGKGELLANDIYGELGLGSPETQILNLMSPDGVKKEAVVMKWIDGLERLDISNQKTMDAYAEQLAKFHITSGLTENWDVVGLNYDNLLVKEGKLFIIDSGGAFKFRAQGAVKTFGPLPDAVKTLLLENPQAKTVFTNAFNEYTTTHADELLVWMRGLSDEKLDMMFINSGLIDRSILVNLKSRRDEIQKWLITFKKELPKIAVPTPGDVKFVVATSEGVQSIGAVVTEVKQAGIVGKAIRLGREDIEDLNALLWVEKTTAGKPVTVVKFKMTQRGSEALERKLFLHKEVAQEVADDMFMAEDVFWNNLIAATKTINYHAIDKKYNVGIIEVALSHREVLQTYATSSIYVDQPALKAMAEHYLKVLGDIEVAYKKQLIIDPINRFLKPAGLISKQASAVDALQTIKQYDAKRAVFKFGNKRLENGEAVRMAGSARSVDGAYLIKIDDVDVKFIPYNVGGVRNSDAPFALRGTVHVEIQKDLTPETYRKILDSLTRIGIDVTPPSDSYMELLYLRQGSYINSWDEKSWFKAIWDSAKTDDQKVIDLKNAIKKNTDIVLPMEKNVAGHYPDWYDPLGKAGYGGKGWRFTYRWDLPITEVESKMKKYVVAHHSSGNLTETVDSVLSNGGQFTSTTERLRVGGGISRGMSPDKDLETGGASYLFTRIHKRSGALKYRNSINFKVRTLSRMDAISYPSDRYGQMGGTQALDYVRKNRGKTIADFVEYASNSDNETAFKHGLSLIDDIDFIVARDALERDELIRIFKRHGYLRLPDRRRIEDIIFLEE